MCGRFVSTSSSEVLARRFGVDEVAAERAPSHNIAPSSEVFAILDHDGRRRLGLLRWGFVPSWADDPSRGVRPINARAEGAAGSRMFRGALAARRCVVPMDGWYEWRASEDGGPKRAFHLALVEPGPFAVAALRSVWRPPSGAAPLHSVALLTTAARGPAAEVHDRMPLVVPDGLLDDWLDPATSDPVSVLAAVVATEVDVAAHEVSTRVNRVGTDGPDLIAPIAPVAPSGAAAGIDPEGRASGGAGR